MSTILISYNNNQNDPAHDFFEFCIDQVKVSCDVMQIGYQISDLTTIEISRKILNSVACVIASHGDKKSIANERNEDVISDRTFNHCFSGKLLYAIVCSCGQELKPLLEREGLCSFWGYNDELVFKSGYRHFADAVTSGIISLIQGDTIGTARLKMCDTYERLIDELDLIDPTVAAMLNDDFERLVIFGDDNLTLAGL